MTSWTTRRRTGDDIIFQDGEQSRKKREATRNGFVLRILNSLIFKQTKLFTSDNVSGGLVLSLVPKTTKIGRGIQNPLPK